MHIKNLADYGVLFYVSHSKVDLSARRAVIVSKPQASAWGNLKKAQ